ncbi:hypothetical protein [Endozoicomonas acroporae]|uniref:hypothetical protein n=1 Tax=Endozoicomonas acroporae TaxID=1701104 RepID=UPI0013D74789|nr:hypothetical protein [Endozoicomonas acroporae]
MDLQYPGSGYDHTIHSPREQNLPHSATASSREEAKTLYHGMKTDKFSPDSDTLQLSSHLHPSAEEHAKQLPTRKRKIPDQHYQSAFTLNTNKESTSQSFSALIARADEQAERLRILLEGHTASLPRLTSTKREHRTDQPQFPLSSHPPQQARATEIKPILQQSLETQITEPHITGPTSSETRAGLTVLDDPAAASPFQQPDADTAEALSGSTGSALQNQLSQDGQLSTSSSASSIEGVYEIQEYPVDVETDQRSPGSAVEQFVTTHEFFNQEQYQSGPETSGSDDSGHLEDEIITRDSASYLSLMDITTGPPATDQNPITQTITHSLESKVVELEISGADKEEDDATAINDTPEKTGTQPDKASVLPSLSDSATETDSLAEAKLSPKNEDDIQLTSESMQKEKPAYKKLTISVVSVANPHLKPAKKTPERLDTNQGTSAQDTVVPTARKKSVRWAASVEQNRSPSVQTETQKPQAEPLRSGSASISSPAKSVIGAKKAATVGTPSELSDGPRTRSIKITYEYQRRHYEVYKQTFSPDTTLEVIQQRMNAEISKFKSSGYKSQYPIRAEINSVIEDLPDSKRTISVDVPGTRNVERQDSAATSAYEQKTASLLDQLKNAEAESDSY